MYPSDLLTSRLRLGAVTSEYLYAEAMEPQKLGSLLRVSIPPEWPSADWDANVFAIIQRQYAEHPNTCGWHPYVILPGNAPVLIGALGAFPKPDDEAEIGYGILPTWRCNEGASLQSELRSIVLFGSARSCSSPRTGRCRSRNEGR